MALEPVGAAESSRRGPGGGSGVRVAAVVEVSRCITHAIQETGRDVGAGVRGLGSCGGDC